MIPAVVALIAETDCEAIGDGLLRQPANAISSLWFVVLGVALMAPPGGERRGERAAFSAALIATGVGSLLYHGPQGPIAHYLHDVTFAAMLGVLATATLGATQSSRLRFRAAGAVVPAIAVVRLVAPGSITIVAAVLLAGLVAGDVLVRRRRLIRRRWYAAALIGGFVAAAALAAGRTGSPLCDPAGLIQSHAVWHVMAGSALTAYFVATAPARRRDRVAA